MPAPTEFGRLPTDLRSMRPKLRRQLRKQLREAAEPIAADARRRASWSTRIPGAIKVVPGVARGSQVVVRFRVSAAQAPHARPYEGLSGRGGTSFFRHPVFGGRAWRQTRHGVMVSADPWVSQQTRPFIEPALRAGRDKALRAVDAAIQQSARDSGFS